MAKTKATKNVVTNDTDAAVESLPTTGVNAGPATTEDVDSKVQMLQQQALTAVYAITGQKAHQNAVNLLAELAKLANTNLFTKFDENDNEGKPTGRSAVVFAMYADNEVISRIQTAIASAIENK